MLQACRLLRNESLPFVLTLAGLPTRVVSQLSAEVQTLGLHDRVRVLGWHDDRELAQLSAETTAFLLLRSDDRSSWACFPVRLPEFLLQCKPVILTAIPDFNCYFEDQVNAFLVPPNDPVVLAEKMKTVIARPELAVRVGQAAYQVALERFSYEKLGPRLLTYLECCVGG
jgi:glycosyltransferase involved in cell wall biosynthesis